MMDVGKGKLMIMNADFTIIQCQANVPKQRPGCSSSRVEFMCGCSIYIANNNSNAAMPARLTNCVEQTTEYIIEFPVNLAVLATVFDLEEIADVRGDEVFPQEQIPRIPSIEVSKDFEVNINRDYAYSMDLKQVLKQASSK